MNITIFWYSDHMRVGPLSHKLVISTEVLFSEILAKVTQGLKNAKMSNIKTEG